LNPFLPSSLPPFLFSFLSLLLFLSPSLPPFLFPFPSPFSLPPFPVSLFPSLFLLPLPFPFLSPFYLFPSPSLPPFPFPFSFLSFLIFVLVFLRQALYVNPAGCELTVLPLPSKC
jgi:hypothetical protein